MNLVVGNRAVLRPAGDNEQLTRPEHDVAVAELDRQLARQDEEQFVGVLMAVPDEFALNLDDLDLVVIQLRNGFWRSVFGEQAQFLG